MQVKSGTKTVTVDLDARSCDCRKFDLTGIPCAHAIAAIHDRRHNPVDYLSEYYKRPLYLASYNYSLEAIKGEEFWEVYSTDELLSPDIPKKLRGRPKKLRRREHWEGGNRCQAQGSQPIQGPVVQRFTNKRVMHCSLCKQSGHNKKKCPTKKPQDDEEAEMTRVERGEPTIEQVRTKGSKSAKSKQKSAKELRRQKMQVRRKDKDMGDTTQNEKSAEVPENEQFVNFEDEAEKEKSAQIDELLVQEPISSTDRCKYVNFQERLRGNLGHQTVFMPTPGLATKLPPGGTPPPSTPPFPHGNSPVISTQQSGSSYAPKRKATRLSTHSSSSKFNNSEDDPVTLGD